MPKKTFKMNSQSTANALESQNDNHNVYPNAVDINRYLGLRIGDYKFSTQTEDFNNWLLCDGRQLLISEYQNLYSVIGNSFNNSPPSGYFNIPDFRSRIVGIIGPGQTGPPLLSSYELGDQVGEQTHTLTIPEMPTHLHTGTTDSAGVHNHAITDPGHTHGYQNQPNSANPAVSLTTMDVADNVNVNQTTTSAFTNITINNNGAHVHTFTSNNTGGSQPHNNMQPTMFGSNVFIYSKISEYISLESYPLIELIVLTNKQPYVPPPQNPPT